MSALFLLSALIAIAYLMAWMIENDGAQRIEDQTGLLRMAVPKAQPTATAGDARPKRRLVGRLALPAVPRGPAPSQTPSPTATPGDDQTGATTPDTIVHPLWRHRPDRRKR